MSTRSGQRWNALCRRLVVWAVVSCKSLFIVVIWDCFLILNRSRRTSTPQDNVGAWLIAFRPPLP